MNLNVWHLAHRSNLRNIQFDFTPDIPTRDVGGEAAATYEAAARFAPEFGKLQRQGTEQFLLGVPGEGTRGLLDIYQKDLAPAFAATDRAASTAQREADIADVTRMGGAAVEAFRGANPQQKQLVDRLNTEAMDGLNAGYNLPPGLARTVSQSARTAQADRGMGYGPSDAYAETLATSDAAANYYGQNFNRATQVAGINQATGGDAFQLVTGRGSGAGGMNLLGLGNQNASNTLANVNGMTGNVLDFNANAGASRSIIGSQNDAGMVSGLLSSL